MVEHTHIRLCIRYIFFCQKNAFEMFYIKGNPWKSRIELFEINIWAIHIVLTRIKT